MKTSLIVNLKAWPKLNEFEINRFQNILIYDRNLLKNPSLAKWIKQFQVRLSVTAGENLKTIEQYAKILSQIQSELTKRNSISPVQFISLGGGSVGDFVGFIASTYKRGSQLIHVPTTWLSAVDSAHGGKTALNLNGVKNQIGTFYSADKIILSEKILKTQPAERAIEGCAELLKIGLINQPRILNQFDFSQDYLWNNLNLAVKAKMKIVNQDPFEKKGIRHVLNLGHTMGHVYESALDLPHGRAVLLGLLFSIRWSYQRKDLNKKDFLRLLKIFSEQDQLNLDLKKAYKIPSKKVNKLLIQDKKIVQNKKIRFVFVKTPGKTFICNVSLQEIISEYQRQGFSTI